MKDEKETTLNDQVPEDRQESPVIQNPDNLNQQTEQKIPNQAASPPEKQPPDSDSSEHQVVQSSSETNTNTGEEDGIQVTNEEFANAVSQNVPEGASLAVCSKPGDPEQGGWKAKPISQVIQSLSPDQNNYINCSSVYESEDGSFNVKIMSIVTLHFLVLDDVGTKIPMERFDGFEPSWLIETSPGNYQMGIILDKPITDIVFAGCLIKALIEAGLCDPGASGVNRWARLPVGINGKPKYRDKLDKHFRCRLKHWAPKKCHSVEEIIAALGLKLIEHLGIGTQSSVVEKGSNTNPPNETHSAQPSESDSGNLDKLKKLLEHIDPDIGYQKWLDVLMVIFNETKGSDEGLALSDVWSSEGKKYKGSAEIRSKWKSFNLNQENPLTIRTLYKMVQDNGGDLKAILGTADEEFECYDKETETLPSLPEVPAKHNTSKVNTLDSAQCLDPASFPNKPTQGSYQVPATIPNTQHLLESYRITPRYNTISKKLMITIPGHSGMPDNADNSALAQIISLATLNNMQIGQLKNYIAVIADRNPYNPIADWINSKPCDGKDRIKAICDTLVQHPDFPEELKIILVKKWLLSAVAAVLKPNGFKSRGVLTIQGPQSIGKTAWVNALVPDEALQEIAILLDHHLDAGNKDSIITAICHWIVEIGELDSSFKKDIARLKGFLTNDCDKVRRPYGMVDSEYPRRTVFCATVNDNNFLVDPTGNTRWWTIPVIKIDYEHNIDMQQVFAQLAVDFRADEQWWLTQEEEKLLEKHNANHRQVSVIREKILDYIDLNYIDAPNLSAMTAIELLIAIGIENPTNPKCKECGGILRELLGDPKRIKGRDRWRIPKKKTTSYKAVKEDESPVDSNNEGLDDY